MVDIWLMWTYQCTIAQQILVNEVKLCTLKVQHDVQLAMAKFCWSIKDCQSRASFNDSTIKGLGTKNISLQGFSGGDLGIPHHDFVPLHQSLVPPHKNVQKQQKNNSNFVPPSRSCAPTKISRNQKGQQQPMFLKQ